MTSETVLPYVHPLWQGIALVCAALALRWGLSIRRTRLRGGSQPRGAARRIHTRLGIAAIVILTLGHVGGLTTMIGVRGEPAFQTTHGSVGSAAVVLFLLAGYYGLRLRQSGPHQASARELHIFCNALALFLTLAAAVMGFPLLP